MHEAGVARKIVDAACRVSLAEGARPMAIMVEVDPSCRDLEGMRLHTLAAAQDTLADGIDVRISRAGDLDQGNDPARVGDSGGQLMCVSLPGLVVSIDRSVHAAGVARAQFLDGTREVDLTMTPDVDIGDHVIAHSGYAIRAIDAAAALAAVQTWGHIQRSSP